MKEGKSTGVKLAVFELSDQVGGRVATQKTGSFGFHAEIGAMRIRQNHALVSSLVKELGLETVPFAFDTAMYFLRGRRLLVNKDRKMRDQSTSEPSSQSGPTGTPQAPAESQIQKYRGTFRSVCSVDGKHTLEDGQTAYILNGQKAQAEASTTSTGSSQQAPSVPDDPDQLLLHAISVGLAKLHLDPTQGDPIFDPDLKQKWAPDIDRANILKKIADLKAGKYELTPGYFSPAEWYLIKGYGRIKESDGDDGVLLKEMGFWDFMHRGLTTEQFALARDGLGYQSIIGNWNAAESIPWFLADFCGGKYTTLKEGMRSLVSRLKDQLAGPLTKDLASFSGINPVNFLHKLISVETLQDGSFKLQFGIVSAATGSITASKTVYAAKVILALPRQPLKQIQFLGPLAGEPDAPNGSNKLNQVLIDYLMSDVIPNGLLKGFIFFDNNWWWDAIQSSDLKDQLEVTRDKSGRLVGFKVLTDLPVRQLYFHGPASPSWKDFDDSVFPDRTAIMVYCDSREVDFFSGVASLRDGQPWLRSSNDAGTILNSEEMRNTIKRKGVHYDFVVTMMRYLRDHIFKGIVDQIPEPLTALFENWENEPFGAGWHAWKNGSEPWLRRPAIARPSANHELFIIGDAYSADTGWIDGGLRSAELVLTRWFNLPQPALPMIKENLAEVSPYETFGTYVGELEADLADKFMEKRIKELKKAPARE